MEIGDILAIAAGGALIAFVLWDVFLAVLHIDRDGLLAPRLYALVWSSAMWFCRRFPWLRRKALALAGPAMMAVCFTTWIGLFILGFALVLWPQLNEDFRAAEELGTLTFIDALYYSGITGTVLGHGDITPLAGPAKVAAVIEAGLGFALLTGIVTYLLSVVSGVVDRNALAIRLHNETQQQASGTELLIRCLKNEELGDVRLRLQSLVDSLHQVQEKMHQFPILDLHYRSLNPARDPEPMLQIIAETAVACQLLSRQSSVRRLQPISDDLASGITQLMQSMAEQFLRRSVCQRL